MFVLAPVSENDKGASQNGALKNALRSGNVSVEDGKRLFEQFYIRTVLDSAPKSEWCCTLSRLRTGHAFSIAPAA